MNMTEIKEKYPNCPNCGRHCPIDAVSCPRGQAFVEQLLSGEAVSDSSSDQDRGRRGHEEYAHHDHWEAKEHGGEHGARRVTEYKEIKTI